MNLPDDTRSGKGENKQTNRPSKKDERNIMKKHPYSLKTGALAALLATALGARAGVPLNNLEGVGGVAFNPLAYTAGQKLAGTNELSAWFSNPQVGAWYVRLGEKNINWWAVGVAETIGQRLEVSYGYEPIRLGGESPVDVSKHNVGAKLLVVRENEGGVPFVPAVSVGTIWKTTDFNAVGPDRAGFDYYAVATKLITQTPVPVLLAGGLLSSDEEVTGVVGHNGDRDLTWFGNIDIIPVSFLATGFEYKQGSRYDNGFRNADYWDAHLAWFVNPNLTLVGAYAYTGDENSASRVGLGSGLVFSAQYAF